jgi:hypothetical protein
MQQMQVFRSMKTGRIWQQQIELKGRKKRPAMYSVVHMSVYSILLGLTILHHSMEQGLVQFTNAAASPLYTGFFLHSYCWFFLSFCVHDIVIRQPQ